MTASKNVFVISSVLNYSTQSFWEYKRKAECVDNVSKKKLQFTDSIKQIVNFATFFSEKRDQWRKPVLFFVSENGNGVFD
jgi:hypothetical protein